jgi:acyl-[acyl-carrier-protein]-phospholipid O-acyltransferase/long-chain-fatty-acid--[acyl-carrier-protein] ligase
MKEAGAPELYVPRDILPVEELPVLGSGKTDYVTLAAMAREKFA